MMLSEILYERALPIWREAEEKPFVLEMARGTLAEGKFKRYMLQDYLYLQDYSDILKSALLQAKEPALAEFLRGLIKVVEIETENVHLPSMRQMGIADEEIGRAERLPAFVKYVAYMQACLEEGILPCLTALLQCSWNYAFLSEEICARFSGEVAGSPYKSWFDAYTGREYVEANQQWIDFLDQEAEGISDETAKHLCGLFTACAEHENRLWDELYA